MRFPTFIVRQPQLLSWLVIFLKDERSEKKENIPFIKSLFIPINTTEPKICSWLKTKWKSSEFSHLKNWNNWIYGSKNEQSDPFLWIHSLFQLYFQACVMCFCPVFLLQQSFMWMVEEGAIITSSSHLGFWSLVICGQAAALYRGVVQLHFNPLVFLAW